MLFGSVPFVLVERCCGFAENKVAVCLFFFISSFVCFFYLFLRCFSGLCLLSLSGGSGRITCFFVRSRFVIIFRLCFWFSAFCLFLLCLKFSGCVFCLVFALFAWLRFW